MAYIDATINHLRAVNEWAYDHGVEVRLDVRSFELEAKGRNRYFVLYPQFVSEMNGQRAHTAVLTRSVTGFIGWLPYRPVRWPLSSDKTLFKARASELGLQTPAMWNVASEATADFVLKAAAGSFGNNLAGPYSRGAFPAQEVIDTLKAQAGDATIYAEQFIRGRNLKAWFWGRQVFHLELDPYPELTGDGVNPIAALLQQRLGLIASSIESYREMPMVEQSLAYQNLKLFSVLQKNQKIWIDFRYGRRFAQEKNSLDTDQLGLIDEALSHQLSEAGEVLGGELMLHWSAPVLYSLDGVVDEHERIWWLEMNSNPIFAPTGYRTMLATLFDTPVFARKPTLMKAEDAHGAGNTQASSGNEPAVEAA